MRRNKMNVRKWQQGMEALVLCLGCSLVVSAAATETGPDSGAENSVVAQARPGVLTGLGESALSKAYPNETIWLSEGDNDSALGLFFPERALPAKGALMILPEMGETAASGVTGSLAQHLSDKGWAVLTVGLEAPSPALQAWLERRPDVPAETSSVASSEVDITVDDPAGEPGAAYQERIQKILQAGLAALVSRGYEKPVLLAVGRASNYINAMPSAGNNVRAMIWVAPVFYPWDKAALVNRLSQSGVPAVLELYDSRLAGQTSGKMRAVALRQAGIDGYQRQPVALHQPPSIQNAPVLASRIDAWLLLR